MSKETERKKIRVTPTKGLFIDMLTKDLDLVPAIIDLVDNSSDGAHRQRGEGALDDMWVRIEIGPERFHIRDNCGGIDIDTAKNYAFRFGRDPSAPVLPHSIGRFGVGMKRAIFKMGRKFRIESTTSTSKFVLSVDVEKWSKVDEWDFVMDELVEGGDFGPDEIGTLLEVEELLPDVSAAFALDTTLNNLREGISSKLQPQIEKGMNIVVDGIPVVADPLTLFEANGIEPALMELLFDESSDSPVRVRLYCGLAEATRRMQDSGWHVFCNGRLVLRGDKTEATGWGDPAAAFHPQYSRLRGYAFFDSDDAFKLPWNTMKTGLNSDSPIYRSVRPKIVSLMKPVLGFLNRAKTESDKLESGEKGPLEQLVSKAKSVPLAKITTREIFVTPKPVKAPQPTQMSKIRFEVPSDQAERAKRQMHARSLKNVGEIAFDYYYKAEVEE